MSARTLFFLLWAVFLPLFLIRLALFRPINLPENKLLKITGRVTTQPYQKDPNQYFYLGPILIRTDPYPEYFYGQQIELFGTLERKVINPFKIIYFSQIRSIRLVEEESRRLSLTGLRAQALRIGNYFESKQSKLLPEPHSGLLLGVLLGLRENFSQEFLQELTKTGTIHLVVASGQNVVFFAGIIIASLLLLTGRKTAIVAGIMASFFYCLLTGAQAPVVRATLMVSFAYLAVLLGRQSSREIGLSIAIFIMLLAFPLYLFDLGFQLSVAATSGLVFVLPKLENLLRVLKIRIPGLLKEGLLVTLSAQITTWPIIAWQFKTFSVSALVANLLVVPLIPFMLVLSFLSLGSSLFSLPLAQVFAWACFPFLDFFVRVVAFFARFSWATVALPRVTFGVVIFYYLGLILFLWKANPDGGNKSL